MTAEEFERIALTNLAVMDRVARRYTGNPSSAEDLVGATLLSAFRSKDQFDGRFPVAWFLRVMHFQFLQSRRSESRRISYSEELDQPVDPRGHAAFLARIESLDILNALDEIPDEFRMVVTLCDMEELSYEEAASALQVPIGTIRSRLNRGRKMLQNRLADRSQTP